MEEIPYPFGNKNKYYYATVAAVTIWRLSRMGDQFFTKPQFNWFATDVLVALHTPPTPEMLIDNPLPTHNIAANPVFVLVSRNRISSVNWAIFACVFTENEAQRLLVRQQEQRKILLLLLPHTIDQNCVIGWSTGISPSPSLGYSLQLCSPVHQYRHQSSAAEAQFPFAGTGNVAWE